MSVNFQDFMSHWSEKVRRDFAPFADPGTEISVSMGTRNLDIGWRQRLEDRQATIAVSMELGVTIAYKGERLDYLSFFASQHMADLTAVAKMTLQLRKLRPTVTTKGTLESAPNVSPTSAMELIEAALKDDERDSTLLLMITGEAGSGKTSLIQHMVATRASAYLAGRSSSLMLYVNAQGRALARLNEALATELQDLRIGLTYHSVSTLVRLGLIVLVIDGFDELLGVSGYDDAFSSLSYFIEDLDGSGAVVASARSTYYEQEFLRRANSFSAGVGQAWRQASVRLSQWTSEEVREYIELKGAEKGLADTELQKLKSGLQEAFSSTNAPLKDKPFFVARAVDFLLSNKKLSGTEDLLEQLVSAFVERERTEKLLSKTGAALLSAEQIRILMIDLAEEMWNQETRELDSRTVQEVAEYFSLTNGVHSDAQSVIVERFGSSAFLAPGSLRGSVGFEHEVFFSYFLAYRIAETIERKLAGLAPILGRSVFPSELPSRIVDLLVTRKRVDSQTVLDALSQACRTPNARTAQVTENAGLTAMHLIGKVRGSGIQKLDGFVFPGGDLDSVRLENAELSNIEFRRVDLTSASFVDCAGVNILFSECIVDQHKTRLNISGLSASLSFSGLQTRTDTSLQTHFDPTEVSEILVQIGALSSLPPPSDFRQVDAKALDLISRLVRVYQRTNPICLSDDNLASLFANKLWPDLLKILLNSGIATKETRETSGSAKQFIRRQVSPDKLRSGTVKNADVPDSVKLFWDLAESSFPIH